LRDPPGGGILGPKPVGEEVRGVAPDSRDAGGDGVLGGLVGGPEPALRGGGYRFPVSSIGAFAGG
jgi:hypothetical protein